MGARHVIVVGGGGAGMAAAVMAADGGANVTLLESESELGGSTRLSSGIFSVGGTSVQSALGIKDSPEDFFYHYMDLNQWRLEPGLIRAYCNEAAPAFEWMLELGVDVPAVISTNAREPGLNQGGVGAVWRAHVPAGEGAGIVAVLMKAVADRGVRVVLDTRVDSLLIDDGRVVGVSAARTDYRSDAVILTTGGLSYDDALLAEYYPRAIESPNLFKVAGRGARGDHIRLGRSVDASLSGTDRGLLLVAADFQRHHHWKAGFPPKSRIYVDSSGRRFANEDVSYSVSTGIFDRVGGWCWAVFDEKARLALTDGGGEFVDWLPDVIQREADAGVTTVRADTIEALAEKTGMPARALSRTIERWNHELPQGRDDAEFHRHLTFEAKRIAAAPEPVCTAPFYAVRMRPSELICTHTGLSINGSAEVLDRAGDVIPGLYAAGEAGGGVLGEAYVGGGNSVSNALTMGRVAGRTAAVAR